MFEPHSADVEVEEDDGVDRASCNAANSSLNQSHLDAYQLLQQRATESLRAFTTQPIVSSATTNAAARGGARAVATAGSDEYVALDEMYANDYNRDMDRRWAQEPPLVFANEDVIEEDQRNLFGQQRDEDEDADVDDAVDSTSTGKRALPRMRADDNPRQRKRHCATALPSPVRGASPPPLAPGHGAPSLVQQQQEPYDTRQRPECFLCAWGNALHDGIEAPHVNKMTEIIQQNYGVHHNREIATEVVLYYMTEVYDPALGMAPMTRQMVLEHLEQHTLDARIFLGEAIKAEKQLAFLFKQRMWRTDGTFDKAAVAEYRRSMGALCGYYNMQLARMNFNNGNNAEDMKKQANYMNLMMPRFDQRPPTPRTRRTQTDRPSVPASRKQFV
jgi:hypothetical protein